jgi:hypothetical protein
MRFLILFISLCTGMSIYGQNSTKPIEVPDPAKKIIIAEASCGQCQFGLKQKGCDLAVRIDGKAYFVDGTSIDDHGDAHGKEGFCESVRKVELQGEIINNRFRVSYFKLVPLAKTQ